MCGYSSKISPGKVGKQRQRPISIILVAELNMDGQSEDYRPTLHPLKAVSSPLHTNFVVHEAFKL